MIVRHAIVIAGLTALVVAGCKREKIVGETMGKTITAEAFRERYESYLEQSSERDNILVREKILNNMVNEILIFDDIRRQGFDSDSTCRQTVRDMTLQAVLDTYAKRMATDTLTVSDAELAAEFRATNTRVNARYVYAQTPEEAMRLKARLEHGESFETIAAEVFQDQTLSRNGGSLGFFGYGEMEHALEEAAFGLAPGALSNPVKLQVGYAIVRVDKRVEKPLQSETDFAKAKVRLDKAIRERKMMAIFRREGDAIEASLHPRFDDRGLAAALSYWPAAVGVERASMETPRLPDSAAALPLMTYRDGTWTVAEFMQRADQMRTRDRKKIRTTDDLRAVAIGLATRDVLLDRAHRAGVDHDSRVQRQVDKVREEYLLRRWRSSVIDSIGRKSTWNEDTLRATFGRNREMYHIPPLINVREILVPTQGSANSLVTRLRAGADFATLARQNSIRRWSAERGGELGFASRDMFGKLGGKLFAARLGAIVGPEYIETYYGIFTVIARRPGRPKTFDEARDELVASLLPQRQELALRNALDAIRARAGVTIDMHELGNVAVSPH